MNTQRSNVYVGLWRNPYECFGNFMLIDFRCGVIKYILCTTALAHCVDWFSNTLAHVYAIKIRSSAVCWTDICTNATSRERKKHYPKKQQETFTFKTDTDIRIQIQLDFVSVNLSSFVCCFFFVCMFYVRLVLSAVWTTRYFSTIAQNYYFCYFF